MAHSFLFFFYRSLIFSFSICKCRSFLFPSFSFFFCVDKTIQNATLRVDSWLTFQERAWGTLCYQLSPHCRSLLMTRALSWHPGCPPIPTPLHQRYKQHTHTHLSISPNLSLVLLYLHEAVGACDEWHWRARMPHSTGKLYRNQATVFYILIRAV